MNYYKIEIKGKNPRRFLLKILNQNIDCRHICYERKRITLDVFSKDYEKIQQLNTIYEITILEKHGKEKVKSLVHTFFIFLVSSIVGLFLIFFLSHIIFRIEVVHEKSDVRVFVFHELEKEKIGLYSFKKNYEELHEIAQKIKEKNKDKIEWIEIDAVGVTYQVKVIERIVKDKERETKGAWDIVAAKNGMIMDMYTESGEIKKNKGDYVSKGEVIVSGMITRNDSMVGTAFSKADVYAEVWYKVRCSSLFKRNIEVATDQSKQKFVLKIGNKEIVLFERTIGKKTPSKKKLFQGIFSTFYYEIEPVKEVVVKNYKEEELKAILEDEARKTIEKKLKEKEKILLQKTLKITTKNGKMNVEVFFKVYENIAALQKTVVPKEEKNQKR